MRDSDVRKAVRAMLDTRHAGDCDTRIVEEMGVWSGSVRIDIAVINGSLSGFELKSDRDTLDRLPLQRDLYSRVFDSVELIVGRRHVEKAKALIPDWWGIALAADNDGGVDLLPVRPATPNPTIDPFLVAQLLWKDEAIAVLESHGLARGWKSKRAKLVHQHLSASLSLDDLRAHVRAALKKRTDWLKVGSSAPAQCVD
ncbi:sce7726 family protein [Bradyrhizobium diazoefficiens]|uniref:sce7726 family protein n=2 Tax=Bradyrhizobium diazoefficiens TaxID=1355477 RepID=UPI003478BB22